jgi:5-enolpyruvylshikimate-3-phosphate synthase
VAEGPTEITDDAVVGISYPRFFKDLTALMR